MFVSSGKSFKKKGMVLPFQRLSMSFSNINYYVDVPLVSTASYLQLVRKYLKEILSPEIISGTEAARSTRRQIAIVG